MFVISIASPWLCASLNAKEHQFLRPESIPNSEEPGIVWAERSSGDTSALEHDIKTSGDGWIDGRMNGWMDDE